VGAPLAVLVCAAACGRPAPAPAPAEREPISARADSPSRTPLARREPPVGTPPAPGTRMLIRPDLVVQDCSELAPCPDLLQPAALAHCAELKLGGLAPWRLATRDELERLAALGEVPGLAGYHWSSSAWEDDPSQVWIVDPAGREQATTLPPTRKPLRARCVHTPEANAESSGATPGSSSP
jgi:hypothetical protein